MLYQDVPKARAAHAIQGFDVLHQFYRLRHTKNIPNAEVELIMRALAENVQSYEQVVEVSTPGNGPQGCLYAETSVRQLLAYITPSGGGLLPLSFGLFHQQETIRELTVDIFNELRAYPVSSFISPLHQIYSCFRSPLGRLESYSSKP